MQNLMVNGDRCRTTPMHTDYRKVMSCDVAAIGGKL
jgi:hypothetical protein